MTLSVVVGFGLLASYVVTSRLTRSAALDARVHEVRSTTALSAERFSGVPGEGLAMAETLARLRPLVQPDEVFVLGGDLRAIVDGEEQRRRFSALVPPAELAALKQRGVQHAFLSAPDGEPMMVALAPVQGPPRRPGRPGISGSVAVCVVAPLGGTLAHVERLDRLFLLFTATILALALVLGYAVLGRIVVNPVMRLVRTAERVRAGDLSVAAAGTSGGEGPSGELGELEAAFDRMTRQLSQERRQIQLHISELEVANREIASTQERLVLTEKLASVGELAAGVAHEIGNPIAVLQGYLEMMADAELPESTRAEYVRIMEDAVDRVATIIRDLLDFARPADDRDAVADLARSVEAAANLVRPQRRFRDIELRLQLPPEPVPVAIPEGRLEQVLLNLLLNAADASPERTRVVVTVAPHHAAGEASVTVADGGAGIAPAVLSRIFDPFFTTKETGQGTGLGLAVCHGIAQTWGGRIEVTSEPGEGARFTVVLPRAGGQDSP